MRSKIIRPKRKYFNLSIWGSLILIYLLLLVEGRENLSFSIVLAILLTLLSASTIYRVWLTLIPKYLQKGRNLKFTLALLAWLFFDALLLQAILLTTLGFFPDIGYDDLPRFAGNGPALIVFMWIIVIAWSMIIIARKENEAQLNATTLEKQLAESESQRKQLELEQLKAQLQPHFLFNTLNTIYGEALKKSDDTPDMIMELSSMLDYGLYQASKMTVTLEDELSHLKRYLKLEKKRFRDGLSVTFRQSGSLSNLSVPPLLLMPLVENAIKHGKSIDGVLAINIQLSVNDQRLELKVSNAYEASGGEKGIGLENLRKRLKSLFPDKHELQIEEKDHTFEARLKLNLETNA